MSSSYSQTIIVLMVLVGYTENMTKQSVKKPIKKAVKKVDFEPNKMTFAVAVLAVVCLVLVALIATLS